MPQGSRSSVHPYNLQEICHAPNVWNRATEVVAVTKEVAERRDADGRVCACGWKRVSEDELDDQCGLHELGEETKSHGTVWQCMPECERALTPGWVS